LQQYVPISSGFADEVGVQLSGVPTQNSEVPVVVRPSPAFIEQAVLDDDSAMHAAPPGEAELLQVS
jgi:hypothetical protein